MCFPHAPKQPPAAIPAAAPPPPQPAATVNQAAPFNKSLDTSAAARSGTAALTIPLTANRPTLGGVGPSGLMIPPA